MEVSQIFTPLSMCLFLENISRTHQGQHQIWHMRKIAYIHQDMAKMLTQRKGISPKYLFDLSYTQVIFKHLTFCNQFGSYFSNYAFIVIIINLN